ncbi:hypothetical protein ACOCJ5_04005 [Knoellia sp. CPCC 206450]
MYKPPADQVVRGIAGLVASVYEADQQMFNPEGLRITHLTLDAQGD